MNNINNKYDFVFVCTIFLDKNGDYFNGGAELHLKNIVEILKKYKKTVLVIQKGKLGFKSIDGIDIISIDSKYNILFCLKVSGILKGIKASRVHYNYFGLDYFIRKQKNTLYSGTFHGTPWDFPTSNFPDGYFKYELLTGIGAYIKKRLMISEQNNSIKKMDCILSVDSTLLLYTQFFFTELRDKVSVIFNYVNTQKFIKKVKTLKTNECVNIFYPRNISFARGVHLLVPIAKILKDKGLNFKINLAGSGIEEIGGNKYENILKSEIKKNNLEGNFNFLGRIEHSKIIDEYHKNHIIIIPTYFSEGTSLSCLEGMASGNIVISTNIGGLNDITLDGYNGFIVSPNVQSIVEKLVYTIENYNSLVEKISQNASDVIENSFSYTIWEKNIRNFFKI